MDGLISDILCLVFLEEFKESIVHFLSFLTLVPPLNLFLFLAHGSRVEGWPAGNGTDACVFSRLSSTTTVTAWSVDVLADVLQFAVPLLIGMVLTHVQRTALPVSC